MKENVGILIYSLSGGGAERVVSHLLQYCDSKSINCTLFLMNIDIRYQIPKDISIVYLEKSEAYEHGLKKLVKIPYLGFKYYKLLKKYNIKSSISFLTRPNYINIMSKCFNRKNEIIVSERSYPSREYGGINMKGRINRILIKRLYAYSKIIITNSSGNANDLVDSFNINRSKIRIIYNPIDRARIDQIEANTALFDDNFVNFVTVGRLDDGKNQRLLIISLSRMKNASLRLYIFGEGDNYNELLELIAYLKLESQVFLMGYKENIFEFLKGADCFLFGSRHEGFPNVLIEALACQLPIISTNCKSGPDEILMGEIVETDILIKTKFGILVPENNELLFVEALTYFIENRAYFTPDKVALDEKLAPYEMEKILSTYLSVLTN